MKNRIQTIATNLILVSILIFLLWTLYVGLVGGVSRRYESVDTEIIKGMLEQTDYVKGQLESRYAYDGVYYIVKVTDSSGHESLIWKKNSQTLVHEAQLPDQELLDRIAAHFEVKSKQVSLGVHDDQLVFVVEDSAGKVTIVNENLDVLRVWEADV